jgi:hypothetical protein
VRLSIQAPVTDRDQGVAYFNERLKAGLNGRFVLLKLSALIVGEGAGSRDGDRAQAAAPFPALMNNSSSALLKKTTLPRR